MDITKISELNPAALQENFSFLNLDFNEYVQETEAQYVNIREQLQKDYKYQMRNEAKRLQSFFSFGLCSTWCPQEMASAGFYNTGVKDSIQCFCCGLVLCSQSIICTPLAQHQKLHLDCEFIRGRDAGNILKYDVRVQRPEETPAEDPGKYEAEEARLESYNSWPFYARTQPVLLAAAGFFFTGVKDVVQCFSCRGCLGNWEQDDDPWKEHAKWFPECEFLQSRKSQNEIRKYIQDYSGFHGIKGKHFTTHLIQMIPKAETDDPVCNIFEDEDVRLESFKTWTEGTATDAEALAKAGFLYTGSMIFNIYEDEGIRLNSFKTWPQNAPVEPSDLVKAGFFYTGVTDTVSCFSCGLVANNFEPGDDPWTEHMKFNPTCSYIASSTPTKGNKVTEPTSLLNQMMNCKMMEEDPDSLVTGVTLNDPQWLKEAKDLNTELTRMYNDMKFRNVSSFGDSTHVAIDLKTLYADISIVSKDTRNQPLQQLTLPEVLTSLGSITMLEGEAGSGKTALLRKIAILWASGRCPILSRFSLVLYLSLNSTEREQGLAEIICKQLAGPSLLLTEQTLKNIIQQLRNQVLFLLDDFSEVDSVPRAIEELMQKNHFNRLCLVVAVRIDRSSRVRQYAKTVLEIREFPLYSTVYMLKKLFSHSVPLMTQFSVALILSKTFQFALKTPLFTLSFFVYWVQQPQKNMFSDAAVFKAYLFCNMLVFHEEIEKVKAMLSSCGELALRGLFASCFDFTEEHLSEAAVNGDEALRLGLLSKFTAQRLHPVYRFFHPSFQEFLAGKRMSELLGSDLQEEQEQGFHYLRQINTFLKVIGQYHYLLTYACISSKAAPKIISHLFSLLNNKESFECHSRYSKHLQECPEVTVMENIFILLSSTSDTHELVLPVVTKMLLRFALKAIGDGGSVAACAPLIKEFLTGKTLNFDPALSNSSDDRILWFLGQYPETMLLLNGIEIYLHKNESGPSFDFSAFGDSFSSSGPPVADQDYSAAFLSLADFTQGITVVREQKQKMFSLLQKPSGITSSFVHLFLMAARNQRVPILKIQATSVVSVNDCTQLMAMLLVCDRIELQLSHCNGFVESIRPAVEQCRYSFTRCSLHDTVLSAAEQELLLSMSSVESLEINNLKETALPEYLLSNLNKFIHLRGLTLNLSGKQNQKIEDLLDGFKDISSMEKLSISIYDFRNGSSKLVECIRNARNLIVFHLKCDLFCDFEPLMAAMSLSCHQLREIRLGSFFRYREISFLVSAFAHFPSLKVLDLGEQHVDDTEYSEAFALALGSLVHLEELRLPLGKGICRAAHLIIEQFQYLPCLKILTFAKSLNDDTILELAETAKKGYFQNLQTLGLCLNNDITESGWRNFFQTLDNLPNLKELEMSKNYTQQIKCHATTVASFVRCISRLPSLVSIAMYGWLLDEDDIKMFNAMKEQHPQSLRLTIFWQWRLPFAPILTE